MQLFKSQNKIFTSDDFKNTLISLGINSGDMLCVHSNFTHFGKILIKKDEFLEEIIKILFDLMGENGTLVIPTFTYSFCRNEVYDKINSKSTVGILGEYFRGLKGVWRTNDPIFSLAVLGKKQDEFKKEFPSCFGENSAFNILQDSNAKFLMLGLDSDGFTYNMHIEQCANVSYRYLKAFNGKIIDENGKTKNASILYFVRNLEINPIPDSKMRLEFLIKANAAKSINLGNADITLIDSKASFDILYKKYKENDKYFLKSFQ